MSTLLLYIIIFIFSLISIELLFYGFRTFMYPDRAEVRRRLRQHMADEETNDGVQIYKKKVLSHVPFLNRILSLLPMIDRLQLLMYQANAKFTLGLFLLFSMFLGFVGYLICLILTRDLLLSPLAAVGLTVLPLLYVRSKKKHRMAKFEKQLPEALGLIARALRAGHAFASGMKLAADEFEDPLGPEFEAVLDEINFGVSVADALKNMTSRVDCPDLNFFVVSVILQRETGGNLAEIIEGLAHLMRERFKFRGKVRTLSAEGKLSATILYILPFLLGTFLFVFHPDVVAPLYQDPAGRIMMWVMGVLLILGFFMIKRIVKLDV